MTPSPAQLRLQQALAGDDPALTELMRAHHAPLLRFGQRVCVDSLDADDAVQEAFVRLSQRTELLREAGLLGWLFAVVKTRCLRFLRRARRQRAVLQRGTESSDLVPPPEPTPEQVLTRYRIADLVRAALAELEPGQREVLVLRDIEGLSGEQVCTALGLSEPAMKSRLHRARANLRTALAASAEKR
jgi:RNA polymerase sigma-70 factor, ECF subfamily